MAPPLTQPLRNYRAILERQRLLLAAGMARAWDRLGSYDEDRIEAFTHGIAPMVAGAKSSSVAVSVAFYSTMLDMAPPAVRPDAVPTVLDPRTPFTAMWHALSESRPYEDAVAAGRSVAESTGSTFVQSTARQTGDAVASASGRRIRYRRVAEPSACPWCRTRDGGIYISAQDADYGHDRCNCDVVPVADA